MTFLSFLFFWSRKRKERNYSIHGTAICDFNAVALVYKNIFLYKQAKDCTFASQIRDYMNKIKFWLANSRTVSIPQSLLPALTAIVFCIPQEGFIAWLAIPVALGVCAAHLGMNLADDYFDYLQDSRSRKDVCSNSVRARMDKCHYIHSGKASVRDLRNAIIVFLTIAAAMGLIAVVAQWIINGITAIFGILLYALLGLFFGINYSGRPLRLCYYGLGELTIGLMFGPLLMLGVQAALTGTLFSWQMLCLSLAVGCLVINILYVHSVMEVGADAALDKMTFARLLGSTKRMVAFVGIFAILPFCLLGIGICLHWWSAWYLLTLLTMPMSVYLVYSTYLYANNLPRNDLPRWWMGPMGDWEKYKEAGVDWFLFRWLLARNTCTFFCLILILVSLLQQFVLR